MSRAKFFILIATMLFCIQLMVNCARPLGSSDDGPILSPSDTLWRVDTLFVFDTTYFGDTLFIVDTVVVVDSTGGVDTIIVVDTLVVIDTAVVVDTVVVGDTITIVDTIVIVDTTMQFDTVFVGDTIVVVDTVATIDTIVIIDTIIITEPDTSGAPYFCGRLNSGRQEIVWMLRNEANLYRLEFEAKPERNRPTHVLTLIIDSHEYAWDLSAQLEFILEIPLSENSSVEIISNNPASFGHAIDICLAVREP